MSKTESILDQNARPDAAHASHASVSDCVASAEVVVVFRFT